MGIPYANVRKLRVGNLKLEIYPDPAAAAAAAATYVADTLRSLSKEASDIGVIFATGVSQLLTLRVLTQLPGLPWSQIRGFHLDEYVGLPVSHPASFRYYLQKNLTSCVQMKEFSEIDGTASDLDQVCIDYGNRLRSSNPQLCLLGVGENGHLAFNDPGEADFDDARDVKVVTLDKVCRQQQMAEGWFKSIGEVPRRALTLTIPPILRVPRLIVSVPGPRKARIVKEMLESPISTACPATILRSHPDATVYLDEESASELNGMSTLGRESIPAKEKLRAAN
jgi:glucosamine-6-phosphate deaminase